MAKTIYLYTDGSALGNPGPGGYGIHLEWAGQQYQKSFSQGFERTTNNRMELMAVIVGLELLQKAPMEVVVYSDSKYVVDAVEKKWVFGWEKTNFNKKKNPDLWIRFLKIYQKHNVTFNWVKGHSNNIENDRCDLLAVKASEGANLETDSWYEGSQEKNSLF